VWRRSAARRNTEELRLMRVIETRCAHLGELRSNGRDVLFLVEQGKAGVGVQRVELGCQQLRRHAVAAQEHLG
jgi:hypothetical protein